MYVPAPRFDQAADMIELILTMEVNFSHLVHEETEAQRGLSNLPRVSQPVGVEAGFKPRTERVTWAFNEQLFRACQGHTMLCTWPCAPPGPGDSLPLLRYKACHEPREGEACSPTQGHGCGPPGLRALSCPPFGRSPRRETAPGPVPQSCLGRWESCETGP